MTNALSVQIEDRYGTLRIVARVCHISEETGELLNYTSMDSSEFTDFTVNAYIDSDPRSSTTDNFGIWGLSYNYEDAYVKDVRAARKMVSLLGRVERGLEKLDSQRGYIDRDDYATFVLRIAEVLRIKRIHVRNSREARAMTGDAWRRVMDGREFSAWIGRVNHDAEKHRVREQYITR